MGITLNYNAKQLVNFEAFHDMILGTGEPTVMVHTEREIKRKRKGRGIVSIFTDPECKLYRISFKRRQLHDNTSVPFGYK